MGTIAIGDIHGNHDALDDLLTTLQPHLDPAGVVVFLGDYIDRGPDTRKCVDRILDLEAARPGKVISLCGNHDDWMLRTRRDFCKHTWLLASDPFVTIRSGSPEAADALEAAKSASRGGVYRDDYPLPYDLFFDAMPASHLDWFERLQVSYRSADCFCSHGGVDPEVADLSKQERHPLIWGGTGFPERYTGQDTVVYGHHNNAVLNEEGWPMPAISGRTIGIDTVKPGVVTAVRMPAGDIIQSARHMLRQP